MYVSDILANLGYLVIMTLTLVTRLCLLSFQN